MSAKEDDDGRPPANDTDRGRSRTPPTRFPPYFVPRRPRVVKMRDLSPDTRHQLTKEYYDAYDPWTGIRIAATLGILISLFTLFLIYKSKFHKSKNAILPSKKTSLYLYDDDCELGSVASSANSGTYGYSFAYNKNNEDRMGFPFQEGLRLEEVLVKSSMVECVALKVNQPPGKRTSKGAGPKYGTLRIMEDASRSLPCSPYKQTDPQGTEVKSPACSTPSIGSIASFSSTDSSSGHPHPKRFPPPPPPQEDSGLCPKSMVVTAKKPQDYRSRSTVVAIARRKRPS